MTDCEVFDADMRGDQVVRDAVETGEEHAGEDDADRSHRSEAGARPRTGSSGASQARARAASLKARLQYADQGPASAVDVLWFVGLLFRKVRLRFGRVFHVCS